MSSVLGTGDDVFGTLVWNNQVFNTRRNIFMKNDGSISCLSLTVNGFSFEDLLFLINTKYPTSGINQFLTIPSPSVLSGPIDQLPGSFPAINQM